MTEAERLADFARVHFLEVVGGAVTPEEIGRLLLVAAVAGPALDRAAHPSRRWACSSTPTPR